MMKYLKKHPEILFTILFVAFITAAELSNVSGWLMIPCVRLVLHAISAFTLVLFYNMLGLSILCVVRELFGIWAVAIGCLKGFRVTKVLRKAASLVMCMICPFTGTISYIYHSYYWENLQAIEFSRAIQLDQLTVDIVFSIIGCIVWIIYFNQWAKIKYGISVNHARHLINEALIYIEETVIFESNERLDDKVNRIMQYAYIILILTIPIWAIPTFIALIVLLAFIPAWGITA